MKLTHIMEVRYIYARTFTSRITGNTSTVPPELQEAQGAGSHPVLGRVDKLINAELTTKSPVEKFDAKDIESAVAAITQVYGEPHTSKEHSEIVNTNIFVWTWPVPIENNDQYHDELTLTYFRDDPTAYLELV